MSYRRNPHDDYDYGYDYAYENPSAGERAFAKGLAKVAGARAERESQRIMAVVQHVRDRLVRREVDNFFDTAKEGKQLKVLIKTAIEKIKPFVPSKRTLEAAGSMLDAPSEFSDASTEELYYLDDVAAEEMLLGQSLSGQDPGVLIEGVKTTIRVGEPSRRIKGRMKYEISRRTFLKKVWPYVTDNDVRAAVEILSGEGIEFLRKVKMTIKEWTALNDDAASMYRWKKTNIRSREEFASAYATRTEDAVVLRVNLGRVMDALAKLDFAPDDVVYRYDGTNNSIGGASARGFYVAKLRPTQLTIEGMSPPLGLGICVGSPSYKASVEEGSMEIYGIRTPVGKPKFTISLHLETELEAFDDADGGTLFLDEVESGQKTFTVSQVKGKANRLPGFDPDEDVFKGEAGVDDVRVVVDFLMNYLGMPADKADSLSSPIVQRGGYVQPIDEIGDLRPGLLAMQRVGIDPFSPPVKGQTWAAAEAARAARDAAVLAEIEAEWRENPDPLAYTDPEVAALARAAYAQPMGGMWTYDDEIEDDFDDEE
jgi:hypothetical protein